MLFILLLNACVLLSVCGAEYCYVNCKDFMSTSERRRMMTWDRDKTDERKKIKKKTTSRKPCGWVYEEKKPALFDDDAPSPLEPRRPGSKVGVGAVASRSRSRSSSSSSSSVCINADVDAGDVCNSDGDCDDCKSVEEDNMMYLSDCISSSSSASELDSEQEWEESS